MRIPRLLPAALLFLAAACGLRAQTPAAATNPPATNAPAAAPAPEPIPLAQIVPRAESASDHLRSLNADLAENGTVARLEAKLPRFSRQVKTYTDESFRVLSSDPSLDSLRRLGQAWKIFGAYLASWKEEAEDRDKELAAKGPRLEQVEQTWRATLAAAQAQAAPPEVVQRVRAILAAIDTAQDRLQKEQDRIKALQDRIAQLDLRIGDAAAAVQASRERALDRLFVRDEAPFWRLPFGGTFWRPAADDENDSWPAQFSALAGYAAWQQGKLIGHGVATLLVILLLVWLRRRAHAWAGSDPQFGLAAGLLDKPLATGLFLSLLATGFLYPLAPRLFWALAALAALVPAVAILRPLVARRLRPVLDALILFYFVDQLRVAAAPLALLSRFLFVGEMVAAAAFALWHLRLLRLRPDGSGDDFLGRSVRCFARLAVPGFLLAAGADFLGYVAFGGLVGNGLLRAAYLAVALHAALRMADGLLAAASHLPPLNRLALMRDHHAMIRLRLHKILFWAVLIGWALAVLEYFSLRADALAWGGKALGTAIHFHHRSLSVGEVLAFAVTIWAAFLISRLVRFVLDHEVYPRFRLGHGLPYAISTMLHYAILVVAFVSATAALGVDMTKFTILVSAFGVGIGFGLQNIINNFVSGIILLFERPIKVGDSIQVDEAIGIVRRIGIRASILRTVNGSEIIVPNATLISDRVTNWSLAAQGRLLVLPFNVARGADPALVTRIVEETAKRQPGIDPHPAPRVQLTAVGANFSFELRVQAAREEEWMEIRSALLAAIVAALAKENLAVG